jgi:hypothetical protein
LRGERNVCGSGGYGGDSIEQWSIDVKEILKKSSRMVVMRGRSEREMVEKRKRYEGDMDEIQERNGRATVGNVIEMNKTWRRCGRDYKGEWEGVFEKYKIYEGEAPGWCVVYVLVLGEVYG